MMLPAFLEPVLTPARVRARAQALAAERPLVIMGRGKSGTRLLAWACQHLGVAMGATERLATGDLDDRHFLQTVKRLARRNLGVEALPDVRPGDLLRFQRQIARVRERLAAGGLPPGGWGWKWPETYLIAPYILATFPHVRFLHLVRDGRDLAFKRHLTDDPRRPLGRALLARLDALDQPHHLQAGRSWAFQVERFHRFAGTLPADQHLQVTYEALCRDPVEEMGRVAGFLGLPLTDACRAYVRETFHRDLIGAWRTADPALVREVEAAIGPTLATLGYTLSSEGAA